jgi:chromosome partitioning protein
MAAHGVIIPMQCEYFALEGLADLVNTIKRVAANLNPDLRIIGLLRVMYDPRMTLQQQVSEQLVDKFGDKVFATIIPRNVRLAEAPSYGLPGVAYDRASKGAQAYVAFHHSSRSMTDGCSGIHPARPSAPDRSTRSGRAVFRSTPSWPP